jgi:hypothetical protein
VLRGSYGMKKALILFMGLLCISTASAADLRFLMGATVSTYSSRWPSLYDEYAYEKSGLNPFKNYKAGVTFGIGIGFPVSKAISLEVNALYSDRGAVFKMWYVESGMDGFEEAHDLKGVSFPVLIKAGFLPRPFPYLLAGADLTFILTHRRQSYLLYNYPYDEQWVLTGGDDFDPSTRKWDIGPVVGLGLEIPVSRGIFYLEGRYRIGLTNLYRGVSDVKVCTRSLSIVAGYRLGATK